MATELAPEEHIIIAEELLEAAREAREGRAPIAAWLSAEAAAHAAVAQAQVLLSATDGDRAWRTA